MKETDEQIYAKDKKDYLPVFARYNIVLDHGDGMYVYDTQGKKYIDYLGGIAVNLLGHGHPAVVEAITAQLTTLGHTSNLYATEPGVALAEALVAQLGADVPARVFFCNSGA